MAVDLLLILRLQDQNNLHRHQVVGVIIMRDDELGRSIDGQLGGVLEDMSNSLLVVNLLFHHTVLIDANCCKDIEH